MLVLPHGDKAARQGMDQPLRRGPSAAPGCVMIFGRSGAEFSARARPKLRRIVTHEAGHKTPLPATAG